MPTSAIEMRFAGNQAQFSFGGMEFVTKLVEGRFPDYNRVIPRDHGNLVTLGRRATAGCAAAYCHPRPAKSSRACASTSTATLRIASTTPSRKRPRTNSRSTTVATPFEIGFNVGYLMDVLANMSQDMVTVALQDANSSALVTIPE